MKLFTTAILATVLAQHDYDDFEPNFNPDEDGEHKKGDIQYVHIDQGWVDFAARTDTIFRSLFSEVVNDADFISNVNQTAQLDTFYNQQNLGCRAKTRGRRAMSSA